MDPSFRCDHQSNANADKYRFLKQFSFGKLPADAPEELLSLDLEVVTDREAESLGYPRDRCRLERDRVATFNRQPRTKTVLNDEVLERSLQVHLEDDNVSRLATRTRAVRQVNGEETRLRYLLKPLQPTLLGYIEAHPTAEVSLASLTKIVKTKLKHIVVAPASNRDTCLCLAHDRAVLLHQSLLRSEKFDEQVFGDLSSLTKLSVCTFPPAEECIEGECLLCSRENGIISFAERFCSLVPDFESIAHDDMSYSLISNGLGGTPQYMMQHGTVTDFLGVSYIINFN